MSGLFAHRTYKLQQATNCGLDECVCQGVILQVGLTFVLSGFIKLRQNKSTNLNDPELKGIGIKGKPFILEHLFLLFFLIYIVLVTACTE